MSTLGIRAAHGARVLSVPCLLAAFACGDPAASVDAHELREAPMGTLEMPIATQVNDVRYRLLAGFSLSGPVEMESLQENGSGTIVYAILPEGEYEVTLKEGWQLERQVDSGFQSVVAFLASPNPRRISIANNRTTMVAWLFRTDAEPVNLEPPGTFQGNLAVSDSTNPGTRILGDVAAAEFGHVYALQGVEWIEGSLTIEGGVDTIAHLASLSRIDGDLSIDGTALTSLAGLEALGAVGGTVRITNNAALPTCAAEALLVQLGIDPAAAEISGNDDAGVCP